MMYVKENSSCTALSKNYDLDIASLKTKTAVYITKSSTSGNWYYRIWSDKTIELWLKDTLTYGISNLTNSGILPDIKIAFHDLTLPFSVLNGAISVSISWQYTEWVDAHFVTANSVRIRRFGNQNTNEIPTSITTVYIIGKQI